MKLSVLSLALATLADAQSHHLSYRNSSSAIPPHTSHPVTTKFSTSLSPSTVPSSSSSTASTKTSALSAGQTAIPIAGVVLVLTALGAGCYLYLGKGKAAMALAAGGTVQVPPAGIDGGVDPSNVRRLDDNSDEPDRDRNPPSSAPVSQSRAVTSSSSWVTSTTPTFTSSSASATPSAPVLPFVIYSTTNLTPDEFDKLEADLEKYAAPEKLVKLGQTGNERLYMLLCTEEVADKIADDTRIAWIVENDALDEPDDSVTDGDVSTGPKIGVKPDAGLNGIMVDPQGTVALSQPPDLKDVDPNNLPGYAYAEIAGRGVTVYIVDTGANPRHIQYTESPGKKRWIFVPEDPERREADADGHGSCIQSIINGQTGGVAKNVDLVIVKIPKPIKVSAFFSALILIDEDIKMNNLQGKAVVSISLGIEIVNRTQTTATGKTVLKEKYEATRVAMRTFISNILELDVPVVVSSGNGRKDWNNVEAIPSLISQDTDLITVGSVDNSGLRTVYSQGTVDEVTISTVGNTVCAQRSGAETWRELEGTSVSTPFVAGVIATWLADPKYRDRLQVPGKVVANVKTLMKELQYIKKPASTDPNSGYPVLWNGVDVFECGGDSGAKRANAACKIESSTTLLAPVPSSTGPAQGSSSLPVTNPTSAQPPPPRSQTPPPRTALYTMTGSSPGGTTSCFPGSFDVNIILGGRSEFDYEYKLDSPVSKFTVGDRTSSTNFISVSENQLSGNGRATIKSGDLPFYTCLTNNGDLDANINLSIFQ